MSSARQTVKFGKGRLKRFAAVKTYSYAHSVAPNGRYKVVWRSGVVEVKSV